MTWSLSPTISKNKLQKTDRRLMLPVGFLALSPALLSLLLLLLGKRRGGTQARD